MNATGYKILGYTVWHAGKWYASRRLPSSRALALSAASILGTLGAAALIARRLGD